MVTDLRFRILITAGLLFLLSAWVDLGEIKALIVNLRPVPLLMSVFLAISSIVLSAYKWKLLLDARGYHLTMLTLTKIYFVGLFMNNFLPSSIGGDVMRIYQVGKKTGQLSESAASVVLERLLATIGLALLAVMAMLPNFQLLGNFSVAILLFLVLSFIVVYLLVNPTILQPLTKLSWSWWQKALVKIREVGGIIKSFRDNRGEVLKVIGYSMLFQLMVVLINYYALQALSITKVSLWQCALVIPIISAVSMLPVSINGLGIREASYVVLFAPFGIKASQAITLSMLFFIVVLVVSLIGGLLFITDQAKGDYFVQAESN